jgi:hypothetical protein
MKCVWVVLLLTTVVQGADVTLWMTGHGMVSNPIRCVATEQATRMFAAIGVQLKWKTQNLLDPDGRCPHRGQVHQ